MPAPFRLLLAGVLYLLTTYRASAQEVLYSTYEDFDLRSGDFSIIGKVANRLYTYRASAQGFFLDAWDDSMNREATIVLDFFPNKIYETRFIASNNQIIALYQSIEGTKITQFAALLDERGRLVKGPMTLATARTGILGADRDYFSSIISENKKWILIHGFNDRKSDINGTVIWLNDSLRITDRATARFDADGATVYGEGLLGNDGTLYLPVYNASNSNAFGDQAWLLTLPRSSRKFQATPLPIQDAYVNGLTAKHDFANNRLYILGFQAERRNGSTEGLYFARYDLASNTWINNGLVPFDESMRISTGFKKLKQAFNDFTIRQVVVRKDGGFVLLAENYYVTSRNNSMGWGGYYSFYNGPFMTQTVREYHYNDVLALSCNETGSRDWFSFVRKEQYSQEDGGVFSSYAMLNTGGAFGIIFNDFSANRSRIGLATINATGDVDMRYLAQGDRNAPDWLPRSGKQIGLRDLVVPCMRRRQLCFARVIFQ